MKKEKIILRLIKENYNPGFTDIVFSLEGEISRDKLALLTNLEGVLYLKGNQLTATLLNNTDRIIKENIKILYDNNELFYLNTTLHPHYSNNAVYISSDLLLSNKGLDNLVNTIFYKKKGDK